MFAPHCLKRKFIILLPIAIFICLFYNIFVIFNLRSKQINKRISMAKECFKLKTNVTNINFFEDINDSKIQPTVDRTIFFHETSCSTNGIVSLNAR